MRKKKENPISLSKRRPSFVLETLFLQPTKGGENITPNPRIQQYEEQGNGKREALIFALEDERESAFQEGRERDTHCSERE